eukprot:IDg3305t1
MPQTRQALRLPVVRAAGGRPLPSQRQANAPGDGSESVTGTVLATNRDGFNKAVPVKQIPTQLAGPKNSSPKGRNANKGRQNNAGPNNGKQRGKNRNQNSQNNSKGSVALHPTKIYEETDVTLSLQLEIARTKHVPGNRASAALDSAIYVTLSISVTWDNNEHNERLRRMENLISYPDQDMSAPKIEPAISEAVPSPLIPPAAPIVPAAMTTDAAGTTQLQLNLEQSARLFELVTRSGNNGSSLPLAIRNRISPLEPPNRRARRKRDDSREKVPKSGSAPSGLYERTKGLREPGVAVLRPADSDFDKLTSYRYYRISAPPNYKRIQLARRLAKTIQSLKTFMQDTRFTGGRTYPRVRFPGALSPGLHLLGDQSETGFRDWPTAVNWLLRTYATDDNINRAAAYFVRQLPAAIQAQDAVCQRPGPAIAESVRITMTPDTNLAQLLDRARKQGNTIRFIYAGAGSSMRRPTPLLHQQARRRTPSAVSFADAPSANEYEDRDQLMYMDGFSVPTEDLPSTTQATSMHSEDVPQPAEPAEYPLLAYEGRRRNPGGFRVAYGNNRQPYAYAAQPAARSGSPGRVERLICYRCYGLGHVSASFRLDPVAQAYLIVENWRQLRPDEKRLMRPDNMKKALQSLLHSSAPEPVPQLRVEDVLTISLPDSEGDETPSTLHLLVPVMSASPLAVEKPFDRPDVGDSTGASKIKETKRLSFYIDGKKIGLCPLDEQSTSVKPDSSQAPLLKSKKKQICSRRRRTDPYGYHPHAFSGSETPDRKQPVFGPYTNFGRNPTELTQHLTVLDTGASSNFVRTSALSESVRSLIQQGTAPDIRDANRRPLRIEGAISLCIQVGNLIVKDEFYVCDRLAAPYILGCTFLDRHVRAIFR